MALGFFLTRRTLSGAALAAVMVLGSPNVLAADVPYTTGDGFPVFDMLFFGPIKAARALGGMGLWTVTLPASVPSGQTERLEQELIYDALRDIADLPPDTTPGGER